MSRVDQTRLQNVPHGPVFVPRPADLAHVVRPLVFTIDWGDNQAPGHLVVAEPQSPERLIGLVARPRDQVAIKSPLQEQQGVLPDERIVHEVADLNGGVDVTSLKRRLHPIPEAANPPGLEIVGIREFRPDAIHIGVVLAPDAPVKGVDGRFISAEDFPGETQHFLLHPHQFFGERFFQLEQDLGFR